VHSFRTVRAALELAAGGATATEIARELRVPRRTVVDWLRGALPHSLQGTSDCATHAHRLGPEYVYLLGLYLGDGCLSRHHRDVYRLRIVLDVKYPGIIGSAASAIGAVRPGRVLTQLRPQNCVEVSAYWKCWPCLFPQHGAGRKHQRRIELTDWQTTLVDRWPGQLLRGLIHSDGCRFQNTGTNWSWPRYSFSQVSDDIRTIFCDACDRLGLRWTAARTTIYVSRKADVAILDEFIGPKR
jgi:Homeodomain-like domain